MPYPWADQGGHPDLSLRQDFKSLLQMRRQHAVLRQGTLLAPLASNAHVVVLARQLGKEMALMAYNNSEQAQTLTLAMPSSLQGETLFKWWGEGGLDLKEGQMTLTIPALSGWVWGSSPPAKP
jgi:hypothetical protein